MSNGNVFVIITVIGDDRPGLVGELSALISSHHGNWLESSMSRLGGKFAGIVKVEVAAQQAAALQAALDGLSGLKATAEISAPEAPAPAAGRRMQLSLVGHDRIGIVREVTQTLARHAVNVEKLVTFITSAAMSAESMFNAQADLQVAADLDPRALIAELERISDDLMVDLTIEDL